MWLLLVELTLGLLKWIFAEVRTLPVESCEDGEAADELEAALKAQLKKEGWNDA